MPRIRLELSSQRGKPVGDLVRVFEFQGLPGMVASGYDIEADSPRFKFNPPPGAYICELLVSGFRDFRSEVRVFSPTGSGATPVPLSLTHYATRLPSWSELSSWQHGLLNSFHSDGDGQKVWKASLSDNQCATLFQVTAALERTPIGARFLADYVQAVFRIGGAHIVGQRKPGGRMIRKTGWRIHVTITSTLQSSMAADLTANGFENDSNDAHNTHSSFGFRRSFRQRGDNPRLQLVLNKNSSASDVDLDNGFFHLSSPMDVYENLAKKFPEIAGIYVVG